MFNSTDTIAALATPVGESGIAVIRVSGPQALEVLSAVLRQASGKGFEAWEHRRLYHGYFVDEAGERVDEVMAAVSSLHPAIEVPDSRYRAFVKVGGPQLIADTACACWFVVGAAADAEWRTFDLSQHPVVAYRNDMVAGHGSGANVLGDPRVALSWIANELRTFENGLRAGDVVITGTCLVPIAVAPGDRVRMDFGRLGTVATAFSV